MTSSKRLRCSNTINYYSKNMRHCIKFLLPAVLLLSSCFKFSKEINIPLTESGAGKLVINSLNPVGSKITAQVSVSTSATEPFSLKIVDNAQVMLYTNGQMNGAMVYDPNQKIYTSTVVPVAGQRYSIEASANGFTTVSAKTESPVIVPIIDTRENASGRKNDDGNPLSEFRIRFNDPPTPGDLYIIRFTSGKEEYMFRSMEVYSVDPCVEKVLPPPDIIFENEALGTLSSGNGIFIQDQSFNGMQKELILYIGSPEPLNTMPEEYFGDVEVSLLHVTTDFYNYYKSYFMSAAAGGNKDPFSEPVGVQSNVKDGYGIFSVAGKSTKKLN
jgi:hypothetical protein